MTVVEIKKYQNPEGTTFYLHHNGHTQIFYTYQALEKTLQTIFTHAEPQPYNTLHLQQLPRRNQQ